MMTEDELKQIEERAAAATPGPWFAKHGVIKWYVYSLDEDLGFSLQEFHPDDGRDWATGETAAFIAASRQDIPALVAEVRRLREALAKVEWDTLDYCLWCDGWNGEGHAPDCPRQKALGLA